MGIRNFYCFELDRIVMLNIFLEQVKRVPRVDRLNYENLWGALKCKGLPNRNVNLIKAQPKASIYRVLYIGALFIRVVVGERQGCILPSVLFFITTNVSSTLNDSLLSGGSYRQRRQNQIDGCQYDTGGKYFCLVTSQRDLKC